MRLVFSSISQPKISVPIIKRRSWRFQNTPNLLNLIDIKPWNRNLQKKEDCQILDSYSILKSSFCFSLQFSWSKLARKWIFGGASEFLFLSKWGLPNSTSIFYANSALIFKIFVPIIIKRRSWQFQNTPKNQLSDEYWPRKHQKTKWHPKSNKTQNFGKLLFSLDCHN